MALTSLREVLNLLIIGITNYVINVLIAIIVELFELRVGG